MLDIKYLRENLAEVETRLATRAVSIDLKLFKSLDEKRRALLTEAESLKARRNAASIEIGKLKRDGKDAGTIAPEIQGLGDRIKSLDAEALIVQKELDDFCSLYRTFRIKACP